MTRRKAPGVKLRGADKLAAIGVRVEAPAARERKPPWIRVRLPAGDAIARVKRMLRDNHLHTVCEEAACPNLPECFGRGTATFMIMGDICTRRCSFCDVAHGRPLALDPDEPGNLARAVRQMGLRYVVITSVDRDDLKDGGADHFAACVRAMRDANPGIRIEILVPDFRGRGERALAALAAGLPDVFNHNLETVPRLYREVRPGADYAWSLALLRRFKDAWPAIPTKSGLMLGLGERLEEVEQVMRDLRAHGCDMLTLGQYLQPSRHHHPVVRYARPEEFDALADTGRAFGFAHVASAPMVRSSYHADRQAGEVV
jgi:lipoic acid synthetase